MGYKMRHWILWFLVGCVLMLLVNPLYRFMHMSDGGKTAFIFLFSVPLFLIVFPTFVSDWVETWWHKKRAGS
ncbi:hypothetical protein COW81_02695 [Candidatus Campbellbacteria bacterium CG22_combo_CG10-13_8_21_14_all_36_13]|uniref:Uncharacterized protein n=1 Tax=Candidatus Campbellbacteria bacterium CG22_combo_CG10-13_8_21_14_all_36_13 TaxID=1974529 RepID=A0A2H0DXV8_9BACT|nr:MAG: hypothetical protein COW81_02695 [Candidatus Campbellbacteria bacterium CG22_combo_CG10-13_8_21_14_all_36_13]